MELGFMHTALDVSLERFHDHFDLSRRIAAGAAARAPVRGPALHPVHPPGSSGRHWASTAEDSEPPRRARGGRGTRDRNQVRRRECTAGAGAAKIVPVTRTAAIGWGAAAAAAPVFIQAVL